MRGLFNVFLVVVGAWRTRAKRNCVVVYTFDYFRKGKRRNQIGRF
jgi:hypothetical protein